MSTRWFGHSFGINIDCSNGVQSLLPLQKSISERLNIREKRMCNQRWNYLKKNLTHPKTKDAEPKSQSHYKSNIKTMTNIRNGILENLSNMYLLALNFLISHSQRICAHGVWTVHPKFSHMGKNVVLYDVELITGYVLYDIIWWFNRFMEISMNFLTCFLTYSIFGCHCSKLP